MAFKTGISYGQAFEIVGKKCASTQGCGSDSLLFIDTDKDATGWLWDFGDGSISPNNTKQAIRHLYTQAGTYTITLTRTKNGVTPIPDSRTITVDAPPTMPAFRNLTGQITKDTTICSVPLTLNPYLIAPNDVTYKWYPAGESTQKLDIKKSGCYSVEVKKGECSLTAQINITVCLEQGGGQGGSGLQWFFGNQASIKFNQEFETPPPTPTEAKDNGTLFETTQTQYVGTTAVATTNSGLNAPEGVTVVVDANKSVLFYTDGVNIFDKNNKNMLPNGVLSGNKNASQVMVVPRVRCQSCQYYEYYTFVNDGGKLSYNIVDMRDNGGTGGVTERNIVLGKNVAEGMTTIANSDSSGYFIITHEIGNNNFKILSVDSSGIKIKTQIIGTPILAGQQSQNLIKTFPSGKKVAILIPSENGKDSYIEIYDFDATKGELRNPQIINLGKSPPIPYSFEISPNGKRLYVSFQGDPRSSIASELRQYTLTPKPPQSIEQTLVLIDKSATQIFGAVQLAPSEENGGDGKIYMAIQGADSLAVINAPDTVGRAIAYFRDGIYLAGKTSTLGLPSIVFPKGTSKGEGISVNYFGGCSNKITTFQVEPPCGNLPKLYNWDFGDGGKLGPLPNIKLAVHTYKAPGKYVVKLRIRVKKDLIPFDIGGIAQSVLETLFAETCKDTTIVDTLIVIATPEKPDLGKTRKACKGGSVELSTTSKADSYVWLKDGVPLRDAKTNRITVNESGIYSVIVSNKFCSDEGLVRVAFIDKPDFRIDAINPSGCTAKDGSLLVRILGPPDVYQYQWYQSGKIMNGEVNAALKGLDAGNYSVDIIPVKTCDTTGRVTLSPTLVNLGVKIDKIENANCAKLDGGGVITSTTKGNPSIYDWRNEKGDVVGTLAMLQNVPKGIYSLEVKDAKGCKFSLNNVRVGLDGKLNINLGADITVCEGEKIELDAGVGDNFKWSTGSTARKISIQNSGTYSVKVSGTDPACKGEDSIKLSFVKAPQQSLPTELNFCKSDGGSAILDPKATGNGLKFVWIPTDEKTPKISVQNSGDYTVKITNAEGCTLQRKIKVTDKCNVGVYVPDAFTPNNDGFNDDLIIFGSNLADFELYIYNRWGEILFFTDAQNKHWNGTYQNVLCPAGVYAYLVRYKSKDFPDKGLQTKRGSVILLR